MAQCVQLRTCPVPRFYVSRRRQIRADTRCCTVESHAINTLPNPFMLKFKTGLIRVCQACRKGFDNDTFVIARQERRMIQNTSTGTVFSGRPYYHVRMECIRTVSQSFDGSKLVIPHDILPQLTAPQKREQIPIGHFQRSSLAAL